MNDELSPFSLGLVSIRRFGRAGTELNNSRRFEGSKDRGGVSARSCQVANSSGSPVKKSRHERISPVSKAGREAAGFSGRAAGQEKLVMARRENSKGGQLTGKRGSRSRRRSLVSTIDRTTGERMVDNKFQRLGRERIMLFPPPIWSGR
ncbi:mechanosensitive ion channel MscS [Striga asiatica]|uniref:Mechanosensitive ion channel MscS n=1 Tax=Striga asiatica TaxID=4170 RepID=A0A5A7PLS2_STRAF|nr:mechanosensitive ion channel MscS [Striga asiatica]